MVLARATPPPRPSITDKSIICPGRSLSVPRFASMSEGVSVRRRARGLRSLSAATGRKIRGSRKKNIPLAHLPPPVFQSSSLPETSRHAAGHGARKESRNTKGKKKTATKRIIFVVRERAIIGNSFHIKTTRRSLGREKRNDYTRS